MIHYAHRQVQGLGKKLILKMNLNQPINENGAHALVNILLIFHVHWPGGRGAEVIMYLLHVIRDAKRVIGITFVNVVRLSTVLITHSVIFVQSWHP